MSAKTTNLKRILIADRKNSNDFVGGSYAIFPLEKPTNIISTKFQLTGTRVSHVLGDNNDWALELFYYDIFGTLYEGNFENVPSQCMSCFERQNMIILTVFILE